MTLLNCAVMSLSPAARSLPASAFASASGYHVPANGAPGKSRTTLVGEAWPSVAVVLVHGSGSMVASTSTVVPLTSDAPHRLAACSNAFRRCAPSVVPGLPPTGAIGVGSLKPSFAPSLFTTTTVAAWVVTAIATRSAAARTRRDGSARIGLVAGAVTHAHTAARLHRDDER